MRRHVPTGSNPCRSFDPSGRGAANHHRTDARTPSLRGHAGRAPRRPLVHSTVWSAAYARRSAAFEAQLDACVDELGLTPDAVERVMQTALELAGSQRCVPT